MRGLSGKPDVIWWFPGRFWKANTVADFWGKWNPGIHYAYFLLYRWLRRRLRTRLVVPPTILVIFAFTGLYHDGFVWLVGFGRKDFQHSFTIFFLMNGLAVVVERLSGVTVPLPTIVKKLLTFCWLIGSLWLATVINGLLT